MDQRRDIQRLKNSFEIKNSHKHYLHYLSFNNELHISVKTYASGNLLDIGCGNKPYEKWFENLVTDYIGCDIIQSNAKNVDVLCQANNIPFDDCSFQTVFSTQVIEHVADHQGMVNEAFRLLKTNGYFILSGPFVWPLHEEPYDFFRFTKYGFTYILEKAGFEIVEINESGGVWATIGLTINHTLGFFNPKANIIVRGVKSIFKRLKCHILVNKICAYLDEKDFNPTQTSNYVIVATKK